MTPAAAVLVLLLLLGAVVALLQHNHHRTAGSGPGLPFGSEPDPELVLLWRRLSR